MQPEPNLSSRGPAASREGTKWHYFPVNPENWHWAQWGFLEISEDETYTVSCRSLRLYHIMMGCFQCRSFSDSNSQMKRFYSIRKIIASIHWTLTLCALILNPHNNHEVGITIILLTLWLRKPGPRKTLHSTSTHSSWAVTMPQIQDGPMCKPMLLATSRLPRGELGGSWEDIRPDFRTHGF